MAPNARYLTAGSLVERGWDAREAQAWADSTSDSVEEINLWREAGYSPQQALVIYALSDLSDPVEWRSLGLKPATAVAYVEAGFTLAEARDSEARDERPQMDTMATMKALRSEETAETVAAYKADLRADSEFGDLDDDWSL